MKYSKYYFALLVCLLQIGSAFFALPAYAQRTSELGLGIGGAVYTGEAAPAFNLGNSQPALTIFYNKDISRPVTLGVAFTAGMLRADDRNIDLPLHQYRRARVETNYLELDARFQYNFLDYYELRKPIRWTPYFFTGIGVTNYNNKTSYLAPLAELTEPYRNSTIIVLPIGAGIKYALSKHWNLGLEFGARKTFTDLLDNIANEPVPTTLFNPHNNDWYYYTGISISYTFYKIRCPNMYNSNPTLLE